MAIKLVNSSGGFPQPASSRLFRNIAVTFVLITVAVIGVALWTSSVRATIVVKAKRLPVNLDTILEIASVPATGQIKGRVVSGSFVESKEYPIETTTTTVPVVPPQPMKTTGRVRITNTNSKDQPLVATTRLLTSDGKLYRLSKGVTVPAGGTAEVDAASDQPGSQFEVPVGTKFTIPGLWDQLQKMIYAESITSFAMGNSPSGGPRRILTADALARAQQELYATALDRAKQSLNVEAGAPADWYAVYDVAGSSKQSNTAVGQDAEKFLAQVKINVTAVFFPKEDVEAYVRTRLNEKLAEGYVLSESTGTTPGQLDASFRLESVDTAKSVARLSISAEGQSQLSKNSQTLKKDLIVGLPADEVIRKWSALDGVDQVDITLQPSWVHRLPSMKDKIELIIQ